MKRSLTLTACLVFVLAGCSGTREALDTTSQVDTATGDSPAPVDVETPDVLSDVPGDIPRAEDLAPDLPPDLPAPEDVQPEVTVECPESIPEPDAVCVGDQHCTYGQECCCEECHPSLVCDCHDGVYACYNTDACYGGGWCGQFPCCDLTLGEEDLCTLLDPETKCHKLDGSVVGKCLPPVDAPACWTDLDCGEGMKCDGASICPCEADCDGIDTPGSCVPDVLPAGCCYDDEDCDQGTDQAWTCAWNEMSGEWGRCMWYPGEGKCWDDGDCAPGEVCNGAFYCPCDALCGAPDVPGTCMGQNEKGDVGDPCGPSGGECKDGLACCYPCGIPDCQWQCSVPCDESEVWCEGGCAMVP
jgi:hypothetical protein